jgi:hypothetical protein
MRLVRKYFGLSLAPLDFLARISEVLIQEANHVDF